MFSTARALRGFTLIELLIVVAILAVLSAITWPAMRGVRTRATIQRARAELALVAQGLENYRRLYGDYPQTGDFAQAMPDPTQPLESTHAQTKFFNALCGVFGPRAFASGDLRDGVAMIDVARLTVEAMEEGGFTPPAGGPAQRREICASLLDPWGRRYLYYYKCASHPGTWKVPGYVLYSTGPDGQHAPPDAASGLSPQDVSATAVNADNVTAEGPMR